jgi:hypothetical protein
MGSEYSQFDVVFVWQHWLFSRQIFIQINQFPYQIWNLLKFEQHQRLFDKKQHINLSLGQMISPWFRWKITSSTFHTSLQGNQGVGTTTCSYSQQVRHQFICYPLVVDRLSVATLTWPSVGVKPNTWKSWGLGVLRDSRMFRARQQDPKHLALGCSWCHWKGLEA